MVSVILLILKIHISFSDCLQMLLVPQILISTVLFLSYLHLRLQTSFTFGSLATGRSLHVCFQTHLFPARLTSCHPYPAALHNCGPGLQRSQAHLASLLSEGFSASVITTPGGLWKAAQQGHGMLKALLQSKAKYLTTYLPYTLFLSRSRIFWQFSKHTNYRLLSWIKTQNMPPFKKKKKWKGRGKAEDEVVLPKILFEGNR